MSEPKNTDPTAAPARIASEPPSEREHALTRLREHLTPGTTVFTILRHVSATGMSRVIELYVFKDNEPVCLTWCAARVLDCSLARNQSGLRIQGAGMDMGYHLVYELSAVVLRDGYALRHRWL